MYMSSIFVMCVKMFLIFNVESHYTLYKVDAHVYFYIQYKKKNKKKNSTLKNILLEIQHS